MPFYLYLSSACLSACLSICVFPSIHLCMYLSTHPPIYCSFYLSISIYLSDLILLVKMNGPFRMNFVSLVQDVDHQDRRQARLSFKDLRDLTSQIKGSGCTCHKPALWNITQHIRMILWNFLALPQCWNIYAPHQIVERSDMIRHSYAGRCHIKTGTQGIIWWRIRVFNIISFLAALRDLIWEGTMADKRYCSIFVRLTASDSDHLHLRSVWCILDISPARKSWKKVVSPNIYIYILYT